MHSVKAQVNSYTFLQATGTYTALTTGRTILATATVNATTDPGFLGDIVYTLPDSTIPFDFGFDGYKYRKLYISTNGFITFRSAPTIGNYIPISSTEGYAGAICALGFNLNANTNSATDRCIITYGRRRTKGNKSIRTYI